MKYGSTAKACQVSLDRVDLPLMLILGRLDLSQCSKYVGCYHNSVQITPGTSDHSIHPQESYSRLFPLVVSEMAQSSKVVSLDPHMTMRVGLHAIYSETTALLVSHPFAAVDVDFASPMVVFPKSGACRRFPGCQP